MSDRTHDWPIRLELDPTAFLAPGAVVVGEVRLGARTSVWFHTVLRGDTAAIVVGEDTNLQDHTVVHVDEGMPARIGARVTVGHRAIVHGCEIEDDCLIGMGAIVLSGARVGRGSLIAAGSLVREGQEIPAGSLALGAPAKVVGPVSDAHRESIERGARHYVELSRSYLARGFGTPHPAPESVAGRTVRMKGPLGWLEWVQLLGVLAESPAWVEERMSGASEVAWRHRPGPGRWNALEVLCHLRDADRDVFLPRLEHLLTEDRPSIASVDLIHPDRTASYRDQGPMPVLDEWAARRERLLERLTALGPAEWARGGVHSLRGPITFGDVVRTFAEHDLLHRRQISQALPTGDAA